MLFRSGVSSFGIGGTNVHLCLRGASVRDEAEVQRGPWVFPVSAKTGSALEAGVARLSAAVAGLENTGLDDAGLAAAAATLQSGRRSYGFRRAVVAGSAAELTVALAGKAAKAEEIAGAEDGGDRRHGRHRPGAHRVLPGHREPAE